MQVIIGPPIALAADLYGRRWFMIVGLTLGMVGAFVTATAHSGSIAILGEYSAASQPAMWLSANK